eukprot:UN24186
MMNDLGPIPPTIEKYQEVMINRYSGIGCDFNLSGDVPKDPSDFRLNRENIPHNYNDLNLHLHGLNVIPHLFEPIGTTNRAAKMIRVSPGQSKCYPFHIPEDHPSGLFWYHPHLHGSVGIQTWSGLAGMIYIEGLFDEELDNYGIKVHEPFVI